MPAKIPTSALAPASPDRDRRRWSVLALLSLAELLGMSRTNGSITKRLADRTLASAL